MKNYLFFALFLLSLSASLAQTVTGIVLDSKTKEPIVGASVYFHNTSVGTITNFEGVFTIDLKFKINSPLVISHLGYLTHQEPNLQFNGEFKVYLREDINALDEVYVVYKDEWTRAYKLKQFREQFLGTSKYSKSCTILNEHDIIIRFNEEENQLVASVKKPLLIKNEALGYEIKYDLQDFKVDYSSKIVNDEVVYNVEYVYYSGSSFFTPVDSFNNYKVNKNRRKAYEGSVMHFMRSIYKSALKEEKFTVAKDSMAIDALSAFKRKRNDSLGVYEVRLLHDLNIEYRRGKRSIIKSNVEMFTVDRSGNHSPIEDVIFGGYMGNQRIGDALPLDY